MNSTFAAKTAGLLVFIAFAAIRPAVADPPKPGRSYVITLVTGDTVTVSVLPDGRQAAVVAPAIREGRPPPAFAAYEIDGHLQVIPFDVAGQVGDLLDPALFDVSELIEQGYDDASSRYSLYHHLFRAPGSRAPAQAAPA